MKRCLFIRQPNRAYNPDLEQALEAIGFEAIGVQCGSEAELTVLVERFDGLSPDVILAHPALSRPASALGRHKGIPVIHWEVDKLVNRQALDFPFGETDRIFSTYRDDVALMRARGLDAHYCLNVFNIDPHVDYAALEPRHDVAFVGTVEAGVNNYYRHMVQDAEGRKREWPPGTVQGWERLKQRLEAVLDRQFTLSQRMRNGLPALVGDAFAADRGLFEAFGLDEAKILMMLAKETAHQQRNWFFESLEALDVFGPEDWEEALVGFPHIRYHHPAPQYAESGRIFAASRINLSLARVYARDGLSDRIFNVLFAGGFLLADRQEPLLEAFAEGEEFAGYENREELSEKIRYYLANETERRRIAEQGRAKVAAQHAFTQRLGEIFSRASI